MKTNLIINGSSLRYIYATFHYNLNSLIPYRTPEEKKQRNLEWKRKLYHSNREKYNKRQNQKIQCKFCGFMFVRSEYGKTSKKSNVFSCTKLLKCAVLRGQASNTV